MKSRLQYIEVKFFEFPILCISIFFIKPLKYLLIAFAFRIRITSVHYYFLHYIFFSISEYIRNIFQEIKKRYRTNEKDGRRIVRLVCLLLAWQKAYQNCDSRLQSGYFQEYCQYIPLHMVLNYDYRIDFDMLSAMPITDIQALK